MEPETGRAARWAPLAGAALLLLAGVVVAVVLRGSDQGVAVAPSACIEAWNEDRTATSLGRHQYSDHRYSRAQITRLDAEGLPADAGDCGVVFPARLLDPEPIAAAMVLRRGKWMPLAQVPGVTLDELADLQADAIDEANAVMTDDGTLQPDEGL
jgi:hypothetical protein